MRTIPLTRGYVAIVDDADYERFSHYTWRAVVRSNTLYATRHVPKDVDGKHRSILMHREVMDACPGEEVDHINHNGLDNRRENLRICSRLENSRNRIKTWGSSQYKGVSWQKDRGKWQAYIKAGKRMEHLGNFVNEEDAARAYDRAARNYFGEFAHLNFPEEMEEHEYQEKLPSEEWS